MNIAGVVSGTPIVCRNCGGDMTLAADLSLDCRYCGAHDVLPPDELGRALDIKNRLLLAEGRTAQLRGVDVALASLFDDRSAFLRVAGVYFALAFVIFAGVSFNLVQTVWGRMGQLGPQVVAEIGVGSLLSPCLVLGIAVSLVIALARGRALYRRRIRPLLLARPPASEGAALRCRTCGGALPEARSVDVRCVYCRSVNLIPAVSHSAHAAKLYREAEAARAALSRVNVSTLSITRTMRRTLYVCGALLLGLCFLIPTLVEHLFD